MYIYIFIYIYIYMYIYMCVCVLTHAPVSVVIKTNAVRAARGKKTKLTNFFLY